MFVILGHYAGAEVEEIDTEDTKEEAEELLAEYQYAFGPTFILYIEERNNEEKQCEEK